MKALKKYY